MTKVILVIGACGLDRLLSVSAFPEPDSKIRTTSYHEAGGGNAANCAHAMALLKDAKFLNNANEGRLVIKLLTKVGNDAIGEQLVQELRDAGVDLTSPLFRYGERGTTTSFTTVIVSDSEFTRTCMHTPGTCGGLTLDDVSHVDMDDVFSDHVVHVHSDGRYADVSVVLAREARRRGITVSVDPEKDRFSHDQDELLELATTVILNADEMQDYWKRRTAMLEEKHCRAPLRKPTVKFSNPNDHGVAGFTDNSLANCICPSAFYLRWMGMSELGRDIVITKGSMGALYVQPESYQDVKEREGSATLSVESRPDGTLSIDCTASDGTFQTKTRYRVQSCGVLTSVTVLDTTGAGDAFLGGYLLVKTSTTCVSAVDFGSWVAGMKLEGPGARKALPRALQVDEQLGCTAMQVAQSLKERLGSFAATL
jgi:sugar/nucleoside kinase (ribokinase family)